MQEKSLWHKFESTGSIKAYLLYKKHEKLKYEMAKQIYEEDNEEVKS